ncbi:MAG: hypothetical protein ACI4O7_02895 [Aristaeellaceae bacterium]
MTKDSILFVSDDTPFYQDSVRFDFLKKCCDDWPFIHDGKFTGLYFHPGDVKIVKENDGMPTTVEVSLQDGLTPRELTQAERVSYIPEEKPTSLMPIKLSTRACPHCHCRLPGSFGVVETHYVTMLGGRAAGKTAFLISLIHQLNTQLSMRGLGTIELEKESQTYYEYLNKYYQDHKGITPPTPKDNNLFPFVFNYVNLSSQPVKECCIVIYDIAGEGTMVPDYLLQHLGIRQAKTVMMILDVNMTCHGAFFDACQHKILQQTGGNTMPLDDQPSTDLQHDYFADTVEQFLANAVVRHSHLGILNQVEHIIAITTKIDQALTTKPNMFQGNCLLPQDLGNAHQGGLDLGVLDHLQRDINIFYANAYSHIKSYSLTNVIQNAFTQGGNTVDVRSVAVSTYTRRMTGDPKAIIFENGYKPQYAKHRIIEPFLLLLYQAGMIPAIQSSGPSENDNGGTNGKDKKNMDKKNKDKKNKPAKKGFMHLF